MVIPRKPFVPIAVKLLAHLLRGLYIFCYCAWVTKVVSPLEIYFCLPLSERHSLTLQHQNTGNGRHFLVLVHALIKVCKKQCLKSEGAQNMLVPTSIT